MQNNYTIMPFNFIRRDSGVLITNDIGEYSSLTHHEFEQLVSYSLLPDSEIFRTLETKFFLTQAEISEQLIEHYAKRYRTKKRFLFDSTALHMVVLTYRCNQSCRYCHASAIMKNDTSDTDMNIETAKKIVDFILSSPSPYIKIEFQGGEPTLNFEVLEFIVNYAKEKKTECLTLDFVVCTNLYELRSEDIEFYKKHNIDISTSLDGPIEFHNICRVTNDQSGTYNKVIQNIKRLRDGDINNLSALMTVHSGNINNLHEVIAEYIANGFNSVFIRAMNPYGNAQKNTEIMNYDVHKFTEKYLDALKYIISLNLDGIQMVEEYAAILLARILTPYSSGFVDLQSPTGAVIGGLIYDTTGNIFASDESRMIYRMNGDSEFMIGNVRQNTRADMFNSEKVEKLLSSSIIEALPGCAWCAYQPYCGSDPIRNYFATGQYISYKPIDSLCIKNKAVFEFLFECLGSKNDVIVDLLHSWATRLPIHNISLRRGNAVL